MVNFWKQNSVFASSNFLRSMGKV